MQSLRDKEIQLLGKMLTIASHSGSGPLVAAGDFSDQWKVLIYDQEGRDIISPLLNVGSLRQKGVTLHLQVFRNLFLLVLLLWQDFLLHLGSVILTAT